MNRIHYRPQLILIIVCLTLMAKACPSLGLEVLIVQTSTVKAYQQAVRGFKQGYDVIAPLRTISILPVETLVLDPKATGTVSQKYQDLKPNLILAVGTKALEEVKDLPVPIIYLMVPNPEAVIGQRTTITGVRMATEPKQQMAAIKAAFPAAKNIGLLHNPSTASDFSGLARQAAEGMGLTLVDALAANDREASILSSRMAGIDVLLLTPDATLISETLLGALALVSLEKRIPLIAFAPKYLNHGAAMVVFTSPEQLGRQAADMAKKALSRPLHESVSPEYGQETTVLTNQRVVKTLGLIAAPPPTTPK